MSVQPPASTAQGPNMSEEAPAQFQAPAEDYDRFMGRYTPALATALADAAGIQPGMRVLDVGCGPGGLTRELAARLGPGNVAAIDPAAQFDDFWQPFTLAVGPAGHFLHGLPAAQQAAVR